MSYYQNGQYQQQPPPPPPPNSQGYQAPYNQYQQPTQNGGYPGQASYTSHATYPGQPAYQQHSSGGGPVQQPQGGQQDAHQQSTTYGTGYSGQYQYNPRDYPQSTPQPPPTQYNPQAYAIAGQQSPYGQQYNPAVFPEAPSHSTAGPVDPYAYSPGNYSSPSFSPLHSSYAQSAHQNLHSPQQTYSPSPPAGQYGFSAQSSPPPQQTSYSHQQSPQHSQQVPYTTESYRPAANSPHSQWHYSTSPPIPDVSDGGSWIPSPATLHGYENRGSPSPISAPYNQASPGASITPGPTPPAHAPSRSNTLDQHPQARPLPAHPNAGVESYFPGRNGSATGGRNGNLPLTQDDLFDEVEGMVMSAGRGPAGARSPSISVSQAPLVHGQNSFSSQRDSRRSTAASISGHLSPNTVYPGNHEGQYSSDSDAEAAQGLAMMQAAEAEDARRRSEGSQIPFNGYGSQRSPQQRRQEALASDSDEMAGMDMSTFGGGYDVPMTYGGDPNHFAGGDTNGGETYTQTVSSQNSSMRRSHASRSSRGGYDYEAQSMHPFPPFNIAARVDAGGTGGLSEPTGLGRRQSYDEGDEYALTEGQLPDRFPDEPPEIFFQQARSTYRPLPAPPHAGGEPLPLQTDFKSPLSVSGAQSAYPIAPDGFNVNAQGQFVPRSTSLVNHSSTPQVIQPLRSKTDAEERRLRLQAYRGPGLSTLESTPSSASMIVDLPALGKRFTPSKLGAPDFKKCDEPWSLNSLLKWLLQVTTPEQTTELKEADVKEALVALFTSKVPTMNIADAEGLSNRVVQDFYDASTLVSTEEWVKIVPGPVSGVIFQLTKSGCYSPTVHEHVIPNMRCYSHHCQRTLKKLSLQATITKTSESWADFYQLKKEDLEGRDKQELEKQNILHEIVSTEEGYMLSLDVLKALYRDTLATIEPSVITPQRKEKFIRDVFGRLDAVKQANEDHLLPQLRYRQQEQGPWILGFSDIFRQWIRKAKNAYVDYANDFPRADHLVRQEMDRNIEFRHFADRARNDKRSNRLPLDSFLKSPISRLQRYALLLSTVLKNMKQESQEKKDLQTALEEVKTVALECDARVAEMQRKIDLADLSTKLVLRPGMQSAVELNLDHFGRELIYRGDLQRMGESRFTWLDIHALLFDHYFILAKTVTQRVEQGGKVDRYDVSRLPIPMDLLILEGANDPPMQKSSYVKGIATVTAVTGRGSTPVDQAALGRVSSAQALGAGGLAHVNTGASQSSLQTVTSLSDKDTERLLYPFKIKHLGRDSYTLFATSEGARRDWSNKIIEAKTKHAAALHAQNAEPFKLRVMADSAFVYDAFGGSGKGTVIKGTPVDRAIKEVELRFKDTGRPDSICRKRVNCATSFTTPYPGKQLVAIGTDFGVYISELDNPRGWERIIKLPDVTQIAVLEEFNLFLLIAGKSLIAYHLDVVCPTDRNGPSLANDPSRKAPQKLSGSKDVGFFVAGKMKDRTLLMYKKREQMSSVFKVLEPVYQKSTEKKRGLFKRGTTEFLREYDEFYIPTECTGINLFHSSLAVSTARGFEVLTLDKKQPWSVPELKEAHVHNIAQHIKEQRALSMLRLSDQEFLLCYANCAVYVNKHGDVSRSVIMQFVGNAQAAALYGPYLVLFDNDFVEVRNAQNGRLKQIIAGREVKCLDDGSSWSANPGTGPAAAPNGQGTAPAPKTLKLVMQHPEHEKTQIVMELLLNENMKES